jgi:hypothetical protein
MTHEDCLVELDDAQSEACFVMRESEVQRLVAAMEECRPSDVFAIITRQPWFGDVRNGLRTLRHLKPTDYLKLSASH